MSFTIENKVALVTGANRGIGKQIVETFLAHGASKVYLAVRNPESTKGLEEQYGDKVVTLQVEVTDTDSVNRLADAAKDVDIVVNNAGVGDPFPTIKENVIEETMRQFNINALGLIRVANAFAATLVAKKGAIVQMNSVASIKNFPHLSIYSASKAASYSVTQGLRAELGSQGVSVLSVHPGPIDTDMSAGAGFTQTSPTTVVSEGIVEALAKGEFHLFPDPMAKEFEKAYASFSENCVMVDLSE